MIFSLQRRTCSSFFGDGHEGSNWNLPDLPFITGKTELDIFELGFGNENVNRDWDR